MKIDIHEIHKNCLDYLITYQTQHKEFYFIPRRINRANRLDEGYYFIGNNDYLMIGFWDGGDRNEKIHNINFGIESSTNSFIEITSTDKLDRAKYLKELVEILETKLGHKYSMVKQNKWRREYDASQHYLEALESFILDEKPIIDEYISTHPESGIVMPTEEFNTKYIKNLLGKQWGMSGDKKEKQIGSVTIKATEYIMTLQHNELQNSLVNYLKENNYSNVIPENSYVDISATAPSGENIFFEIKTAKSVKGAIREAIGQLLEYNHYPHKSEVDRLVIVTKLEPSEEDVIYIKYLREKYYLPLYYQFYDMHDKKLSCEY